MSAYDDFIRELLVLLAEHDIHGYVYWDTNLKFYVNCNDAFYWACADAEELTQETLPEFRQALEDVGEHEPDGTLLYCARRRKMRPQGAMYEHIARELWTLFDACGPKRPTDFGNPKEHP